MILAPISYKKTDSTFYAHVTARFCRKKNRKIRSNLS
uniref:Uncharacterized protein n=1 Tax=Lotus japonicus TaxID=34305 RepID=I3S6U5_LOTJA|nr:unknown [Lotus japonicus]